MDDEFSGIAGSLMAQMALDAVNPIVTLADDVRAGLVDKGWTDVGAEDMAVAIIGGVLRSVANEAE